MKRALHSWYSPSLQKEMPLAVYGHYGFAVLLVPTAAADYLEYERFRFIESIAWFINSGKIKVFSIDSINQESWMNYGIPGPLQIIRHQQWNEYVYQEVVPFIRNSTSQDTPIIPCGASFGALHSMNLFLQRPDLLGGVVAMSGVYDLTEYTKGYFDENVYFNSPMHYLPQLTDPQLLHQIRKSKHIHILTGSGAYEDPASSGRFAQILSDKGIPCELDEWSKDWAHDWNTWRSMFPHYLGTRF